MKSILKIIFITVGMGTLYLAPCLAKASVLTLGETVHGQLEQGISHGFDGMIVYLDQAGITLDYYVGGDEDLRAEEIGLMFATTEDVGIFLSALNNGSILIEGEQETFSSIYEYKHTGLLVDHQSIAEYQKDLGSVIIQFNNTRYFDEADLNLAEIICNRIMKTLERSKPNYLNGNSLLDEGKAILWRQVKKLCHVLIRLWLKP